MTRNFRKRNHTRANSVSPQATWQVCVFCRRKLPRAEFIEQRWTVRRISSLYGQLQGPGYRTKNVEFKRCSNCRKSSFDAWRLTKPGGRTPIRLARMGLPATL
jgi:hypothetical protein